MIQLATPSTPNVSLIPITQIDAEPQIRTRNGFDDASIKQLAESIERHGLLQPIMLRRQGDRYQVMTGHRRMAAMIRNGFSDAPSLIAEASDEEAFERQLAENVQREGLTLADTADAVRTLQRIHTKPAEIAKVVNKSKSWVSKHLTLTSPAFPGRVRALLDDGCTEDLELLLALQQVHRADAAGVVFVRLVNAVRCGGTTREGVRRALQKLKTIETDAQDGLGLTDDHDESDVDTNGEPGLMIEVRLMLPLEESELFKTLGGVKWLKAALKAERKG